MNLKKEVLYRFLITLTVPLVIMSTLCILFFNSAFDNYKQIEKNEKFKRIESLLMQYYSNDLSEQDLGNFFWYIQNEKIDVILYDTYGNVIYDFNRSEPDSQNKPTYVEKEPTKIYDQQGRFVGFVSFGYDETNYQDQQTNNFINRMTILLLISVLIAVVAASFVSAIFSNTLSEPIVKLSEKTREITDGNFDTDMDIRSNITEIQTLIHDITHLRNDLKEQEEIRKKYAQNISHELRTPIANIQLYIEALGDHMIEADEETIATLMHEIHRLSSLVNDLKTSFLEDSEKKALKLESFSLNEELKNLALSLSQQMAQKNIVFSFIEKAKITVVTDKEILFTIVNNLLTNAIKACDDTGGKIDLVVTTSHDKTLISVRDNGVGISEKNQERIFERFFRVDDSRNTQKNGYGLGLSIVKSSADRIDAKILLNSKENIGSEFIIELDNEKIQADIHEKSTS